MKATPVGHSLPGSFFTIFAIWWGFCTAIKHFHSCHSTKKSRKPVPHRATTTFSCFCCPSRSLRQIPLESYIKLICVSIGMIGEGLTGLQHNYDDTLKRKVWTFRAIDAQHVTLYSAFAVASLIEIFVHAKYNLPKGIEFLGNIFAFGVEAFLFHFHVHGQDDINIHVHTLLVYSISFCILTLVWEFNCPNQILASYCGSAATLFQGFWYRKIIKIKKIIVCFIFEGFMQRVSFCIFHRMILIGDGHQTMDLYYSSLFFLFGLAFLLVYLFLFNQH
jgi:hypothetical protein